MRHGPTPASMTSPVKRGGDTRNKGERKVLRVAKEEFWLLLLFVIFLAISFNLILFTMNLITADYSHRLVGFLMVTIAALVAGKAVLVTDVMLFLRRLVKIGRASSRERGGQ